MLSVHRQSHTPNFAGRFDRIIGEILSERKGASLLG